MPDDFGNEETWMAWFEGEGAGRVLVGRVTDRVIGDPVPGAVVRLGAASAVTDERGLVRLSPPDDGRPLRVIVQHPRRT